jgi:glycosyltransferase involved in cell wall biosynthesis
MKRIYFDGLVLVEGHFSGIGQYVLGILNGIDAIVDDAQYSGEVVPEIIVVIPRDSVKKFKKFGFKHIRYKTFPLSFRVMSALWRRGWLPPIDLWCGRGSYIFPRFVGMPLALSKSALVIYDLSYELHREYSDEKNAVFLSKMVRKSLANKKNKKVITISENAKKEILDVYGLDHGKVKVAYPAADPRYFYRRSKNEIEDAKSKYGISGEYILALSNLEPRKNLDATVEAYCQLPKSVTDKVSLLLVGVTGWKTEALFNRIVKKVDKGYNITRPSKYIKDEDKPAIISGAKMLVYPSHYEGFGMPPLEALACGVPVITADNSSLPEVVGKLGTMVPSEDHEALSKAMAKLLDSKKSGLDQEIVQKGPEHAESFSWIKSARVFLDVGKDL